jgi:hypothetical protein
MDQLPTSKDLMIYGTHWPNNGKIKVEYGSCVDDFVITIYLGLLERRYALLYNRRLSLSYFYSDHFLAQLQALRILDH